MFIEKYIELVRHDYVMNALRQHAVYYALFKLFSTAVFRYLPPPIL
jgi:hypothetical protein